MSNENRNCDQLIRNRDRTLIIQKSCGKKLEHFSAIRWQYHFMG